MKLEADHAIRALRTARDIQADANALGFRLPKLSFADKFDMLVTDLGLSACSRSLFVTGHYAMAVEEAYKFVNNLVKSRSGCNADGAGLMRTAFSVNSPILRMNDLKSQSQKDQQQGYMDILAGCMTGIRNPRAHEHQYLDTPQIALELLAWANHLVRAIRDARV